MKDFYIKTLKWNENFWKTAKTKKQIVSVVQIWNQTITTIKQKKRKTIGIEPVF